MWNLGIAHTFHLKRTDMVRENITLRDYLSMVDALKSN